jgi:hypothetical protein
MAETTVIHVRDLDTANLKHVYIGRAVPRRGLKASPWANPFPIRADYSREQSLADFEHWVRTSDDPRAVWIRDHLDELDGNVLVCWCHPLGCHGGVYVKLLAERKAERGARQAKEEASG